MPGLDRRACVNLERAPFQVADRLAIWSAELAASDRRRRLMTLLLVQHEHREEGGKIEDRNEEQLPRSGIRSVRGEPYAAEEKDSPKRERPSDIDES
jgi:hypothetical protein